MSPEKLIFGKVPVVAVSSACRELGRSAARSRGNAQPAWSRAMLRGGLVTAGASLMVVAALAALLGGLQELSTVVATGALVIGFFVAGQLVEVNALSTADGRGLLIVLGSFVARVAVLGMLVWLVLSRPELVEYISATWFVVSGCVAVSAWLVGIVVSHARSRVPVYDDLDARGREAVR